MLGVLKQRSWGVEGDYFEKWPKVIENGGMA